MNGAVAGQFARNFQSTETNSVSSKPRVAMTSDGHAIVVWQKVDGVYATYYIVP